MRAVTIAWLTLILAGCNFDEAFKRYCDKNPNCVPDAGVQLPMDTAVVDTAPMDTAIPDTAIPDTMAPDTTVVEPVDAAIDAPRPGLDGGDASRPTDGGPGPGGFLPPPQPCDPNQGPGACGPDYLCSLGGFCLKRCNTSADCRSTQSFTPRCITLFAASNVNVCACDGASCSSKDPAYTCSYDDFICMRRCYTDSDCRGPQFTLKRICNLISQVCAVNACRTDDECKAMNPLYRCDFATSTCVP